jgi:hypothetical protein
MYILAIFSVTAGVLFGYLAVQNNRTGDWVYFGLVGDHHRPSICSVDAVVLPVPGGPHRIEKLHAHIILSKLIAELLGCVLWYTFKALRDTYLRISPRTKCPINYDE